jgi:hypothetical protein
MPVKSFYVVLGLAALSPIFAFAQTATTASDATNPNMGRYCDPTVNADTFSKIKTYEDQMNSMPKDDPKRFSMVNEISKLTQKLKCSYRVKQQ